MCDVFFFFFFFFGYYYRYFILGVTFFLVERGVERALYAYDSDARRSNSDSDSRSRRCFSSFFVLVIMIGIFAQTLPTSLGAALNENRYFRFKWISLFLYFFWNDVLLGCESHLCILAECATIVNLFKNQH